MYTSAIHFPVFHYREEPPVDAAAVAWFPCVYMYVVFDIRE